MKISIRYRLFLSILSATCLALICMFLIMQWNINRGFLQYLDTMDQGKSEKIVISLEQVYAEHGNWDFLRDDPGFLAGRVMGTHLNHFESERLKESENEKYPPPPMGPHPPRWPFMVLDANRKPLWGNPEEVKEVNFRPIIHNKRIVGYVGGLPPKQFLNPHQSQFLKKQKSALILSVLGLLFVVVIFSLPLANRLVMPIMAMASATHDLASGKYSIRVPVVSSDELGQLALDFNSMALTLEKNEKARRQWIADISHELRTPLSVLRGEIEALLDGIRPTNPEAIQSLYAETLRLNHLVNDLYQLALSDLGGLTYQKEYIDLVEVLKDSINHSHMEFVHKRIRLSMDLPSESKIIVFADSKRLHQLFTNLLDNSLKYTDRGGELIIHLADHNGQAVMDFEDSSPGVPEDELSKLFDRLYRVEASRNRSSGGAGLGLAICKNIVEAHAGIITAHPSQIRGLLIRIVLPIAGVHS